MGESRTGHAAGSQDNPAGSFPPVTEVWGLLFGGVAWLLPTWQSLFVVVSFGQMDPGSGHPVATGSQESSGKVSQGWGGTSSPLSQHPVQIRCTWSSVKLLLGLSQMLTSLTSLNQ